MQGGGGEERKGERKSSVKRGKMPSNAGEEGRGLLRGFVTCSPRKKIMQ